LKYSYHNKNWCTRMSIELSEILFRTLQNTLWLIRLIDEHIKRIFLYSISAIWDNWPPTTHSRLRNNSTTLRGRVLAMTKIQNCGGVKSMPTIRGLFWRSWNKIFWWGNGAPKLKPERDILKSKKGGGVIFGTPYTWPPTTVSSNYKW